MTARDIHCHASSSHPPLLSSVSEAFVSDFNVAERGSMKVEDGTLILFIFEVVYQEPLCVSFAVYVTLVTIKRDAPSKWGSSGRFTSLIFDRHAHVLPQRTKRRLKDSVACILFVGIVTRFRKKSGPKTIELLGW